LVTTSDAAEESAIDEVIEDGDLFGQTQGLPDRENDRGSADFQAPGPLSDIQRLHEGGRRVAVVAEMVLGDEAIVKAEGLRVLNLFDSLFEKGLPLS
jgi:hypothetical protein